MFKQNHATMPQIREPQLLNSWKEIAAYLDRGVRTVQRWEAHFGLPVRRPSGQHRSSVIAFKDDLDAWLRSCRRIDEARALPSIGKAFAAALEERDDPQASQLRKAVLEFVTTTTPDRSSAPS